MKPGVEVAIKRAKHVKENEATYPIPTVQEVTIHRDDMIFILWPDPDLHSELKGKSINSKNLLLGLARIAVPTLGADHAVFLSDGYFRMENVIDGVLAASSKMRERFGNSMDAAWKAGAAKEFGIYEAMVVTVVSRTEDGCEGESGFVPYVDHGNGKIKWLEPHMHDIHGTSGLIFDTMREAFEIRDFLDLALHGDHPLVEMMNEAVGDMSEERQRFHCDIGVLRNLVEQGATIGVGSPDSKSAHEYERSINKYGWGPKGAVRAFRQKPNRAERREAQRRAHSKR